MLWPRAELPDVDISDKGVKVSPLDNSVPVQVSPLAELVNAQGKQPLAAFRGQRHYRMDRISETDSSGRHEGPVNQKYGQGRGRQFYTHISDHYSPFYTCIISRVRDSTHLLDGLLYNKSDLEVREHYTDTEGFTDPVFALKYLLGFVFCPRIRDLNDPLNFKEIEIHWREVLRLATSNRKKCPENISSDRLYLLTNNKKTSLLKTRF